MYDKKIERLKDDELVYADLSEGNDVIVETAGFIPLEVKLKRFEQNGMMMQFNENEFTSSDLRNIYLNPDFEISPEDDLEDIQEKMAMQREFIEELRKSKTPDIVENNSGVAPQGTDKKKVDKVEDTLGEE